MLESTWSRFLISLLLSPQLETVYVLDDLGPPMDAEQRAHLSDHSFQDAVSALITSYRLYHFRSKPHICASALRTHSTVVELAHSWVGTHASVCLSRIAVRLRASLPMMARLCV